MCVTSAPAGDGRQPLSREARLDGSSSAHPRTATEHPQAHLQGMTAITRALEGQGRSRCTAACVGASDQCKHAATPTHHCLAARRRTRAQAAAGTRPACGSRHRGSLIHAVVHVPTRSGDLLGCEQQALRPWPWRHEPHLRPAWRSIWPMAQFRALTRGGHNALDGPTATCDP